MRLSVLRTKSLLAAFCCLVVFGGLFAPTFDPGGTTGSTTDATYLTQIPNTALTAEQALSLLATGFMRVTTTTGVVTSQVGIALTTDTSGNYVQSVATTSPITGGAAGSEGGVLTLGCVTCGVTGSPLSQFAATTSAQLAAVLSDETGTGLVVLGTAPTITGGTHTALTGLGIRSTGTGAFDLRIANTENLTVSDKTLTVTLGDVNRTLTMTGNASITGTNTGDQTITLTGNVTGSGTGSFATTIAAQAVGVAKMTATQTDIFFGRDTVGAGAGEEITVAAAKTLLNLTGTNSGDQTITLTGDVTGSGTGSFAATIAAQTSATWIGKVSDETGTGLWVFGTNPTLTDVTVNDVIEFTETAGDTTCAVGNFNIKANSTTNKLRGCDNGTLFDLAGGGGGASLDAITAAVANQAGIANANFNIRWNWAKTTNSETAFMIGESAASTGGTATAGIDNQRLVEFRTAAASTASPLCVYSRALHVFCVSATTVQILAADGTAPLPIYSFAASSTTGLYSNAANQLAFTTNGTHAGHINTSQAWAVTATSAYTAFGRLTLEGGNVGIARHTPDTSSYNIIARKSRGNATTPATIISGDDLFGIRAFGHVGTTNTYQEAVQILFDSTGTISDSATGIGGIMRFLTADVGTEPTERWQIDNTGNLISAGVLQANLGTPANGSIIYCSDCTIANPCAGAGTGAIAKRLNGAWVCN